MVEEQAKTLEVLKLAIQMEIDGQKYYRKMSQQSGSQLGKDLFQRLADDESLHQKKFEQIYGSIRDKKVWTADDVRLSKHRKPATLFAEVLKKTSLAGNIADTELEAANTAIDMENKAYDFYKSRSEKASYDAEKKFYEALAAEEREHYLALVEYREYLIDPAGWFVKKEHPSLNGA